MKRPFTLVGLLGLLLTLSSCEDVVELNVPAGETLLVVDGAITDQAGSYTVTLSQTAAYFKNDATPRVSGAKVVLTDMAGGRDTLREQRPGVYVSRGTLRGTIGHSYTLAIEVDGEHYQAETSIPRAQRLDSIRAALRAANAFSKAGYYLLYYGQEPAGKGDYFRFKVYQNGVLYNRPADLDVRSDEFLDGNYLAALELTQGPDDDFTIASGDRLRVEVSSLPADYYYYLNELRTQLNNNGLFATSPANVRTNVRNLNPNSRKTAVGYFAGYAVRADSLVVR